MAEEVDVEIASDQPSNPSPTPDHLPSSNSNEPDLPSSQPSDGDPQTQEAEEEEEAGECGFCVFMKAGPCGADFSKWEECMEAAEKDHEDVVSRCWPVTQTLKKCMEASSDYYGIILQAEAAMEQQAQEAAAAAADSGANSESTEQKTSELSQNEEDPIQADGNADEKLKQAEESTSSGKQPMVM